MTIDALGNLVTYLRGVREERKAVLAISDGWLLFRPNPDLNRPLNCEMPGLPTAGFDPRTGRLSANPQRDPLSGPDPQACDRDRMLLAGIDDEKDFRVLLDQAESREYIVLSDRPSRSRGVRDGDSDAANGSASCRCVDYCRAKRRWGDASGSRQQSQDARGVHRRPRHRQLQRSCDKGFKRVVDDLSSYYLLGYYSTGSSTDNFIDQRSRQAAGVQRASAGAAILAATPESAALFARTGGGAGPSSRSRRQHRRPRRRTRAVEAAIAPLSAVTRATCRCACRWPPAGSRTTSLGGDVGGRRTRSASRRR